MGRLNYILRRIGQIIPVLLIISILIFLILRMIGGDPARLMLGEKATETAVAAVREKMGLNEPLYKQYFIWMKGVVTGDMGNSITFQRPVMELLMGRLPTTVKLTLFSTLLSLVASFPLGYIAGRYKDGLADQAIRTTALVFISMPSFWVGLLLMILFSVKLQLLPAGGWAEGGWEQFKCLILPAFTQSLMTTALLMRNIRNAVVDISAMDYVDFAKSKGITSAAVRNRHVLRNSLISTVTLLAIRIAYMLGGSVITETVFSLPGVGQLMVSSIFNRDYLVVQSLVLLMALMVLVVNLITDIIYSFVDPRVSY